MSSAAILAKTIASEWEMLVGFALDVEEENIADCAILVSQIAKVGTDSLKRKILAIRHQRTLGYSKEEIVAFGQEKVLGDMQRSKRTKQYESVVAMTFKIPGSQRELVLQQVERIKGILGIFDSENFWDWWLSQVRDCTDQEILDSRGEDDAEK